MQRAQGDDVVNVAAGAASHVGVEDEPDWRSTEACHGGPVLVGSAWLTGQHSALAAWPSGETGERVASSLDARPIGEEAASGHRATVDRI